MITLEGAARDADTAGEVVQFVKRRVAHQMRPLLSPVPPHRLVDQNTHPTHICTPNRAPATYGWRVASPEEVLRSAWVALGGTSADDTIKLVLARHAEPHRRYHTATHVMRVLDHVDEILRAESSNALDAPAIRAAALFHDIVYDPRSATNEHDSAEIAVDALWQAGWPESRLALVHHMIEATAGHTGAGLEAAVLLDADLAILGAEPPVYAEYVDGVRFEFEFVDDDAWRVGRTGVLRSFLDRERIFTTMTMSASREPQARENLAAELAALTVVASDPA